MKKIFLNSAALLLFTAISVSSTGIPSTNSTAIGPSSYQTRVKDTVPKNNWNKDTIPDNNWDNDTIPDNNWNQPADTSTLPMNMDSTYMHGMKVDSMGNNDNMNIQPSMTPVDSTQ